jgi:hypothetical protein
VAIGVSVICVLARRSVLSDPESRDAATARVRHDAIVVDEGSLAPSMTVPAFLYRFIGATMGCAALAGMCQFETRLDRRLV